MRNRRKIALAVLIVAALALTFSLRSQNHSSAPEAYAKLLPGPFSGPSAVAIGDYDNDGYNDIAITQLAPPLKVSVFKSDGATLIKEWAPASTPYGVAIGDYNNDGFSELAYTEFGANRVRVYKNDGVTLVKEWTALSNPFGVAIGDYNNDGLSELAFSEYAGGRVTVYSSDGLTIVKQWTGLNSPSGVAIGDCNNDGLNELAFAEDGGGGKVTINKNDGVTIIRQWTGLGSGAWGIAIGDFDNDGLNDLAFTISVSSPSGVVYVYRGDGTTQIKKLTGLSYPDGAAIGDLNNDGLNDLAFTQYSFNTVTVYYQTEPGTGRSDVPIMKQWAGLNYPMGLDIGDYDNNGLNEIAIVEWGGNKVTVYRSDGVTICKQWTSLNGPTDVAIGDYNNDGLNDLAVVEYSANKVTAYKSDGMKVIEQWTVADGLNLPAGVAIGDYNNDGLNEIAITEVGFPADGDRVTVYKTDGTKSLIKQWPGLNDPRGVAIGDYDNDGLNDIVFCEYVSGKVTAYKSDGTTKINEWIVSGPWGVALGDYDNDGLNDIAITQSYYNAMVAYKSDGTTTIKLWTGLNYPYGVAIGDYNNDGLNDIAVSEYVGRKVVVYHQTKSGTVSRVAEPTIVTLRGTLTDSSGYPIVYGSVRVTIKDSFGIQVWQDTFNDIIDNGKYNIPCGTSTKLMLIKGQIYSAVLEVDADSVTFGSADVIFGDNSPAGDIIKFVAN